MDDASVDNAPFYQLPAVHHRAHALHTTPHRQGIETRRNLTGGKSDELNLGFAY